jgi:hypothetical protein
MAHGLQVPTIDNFLTIVFKTNVQSYLKIVATRMKWLTFQQHKEATMLCEKGMTIAKVNNALLVPQSTKHATPPKTQSNIRNTNKFCTNCGMNYHNVETCRKKEQITVAIQK